jgi:hypothetical protein
MIRIAIAFFILVAPVSSFGGTFQERPDWSHFFIYAPVASSSPQAGEAGISNLKFQIKAHGA